MDQTAINWQNDTRVTWYPGPGSPYAGEDAPYPGSDPRPIGYARVGDLIVDQTVQRGVPAERITQISNNWDWNRAEVLSVRLRPNGDLVVVEGQNRALSLQKKNPDTRVWVVLVNLKDTAGEAATALDVTRGRKAHSPLAQWNLRVRRGDEREIMAEEVIARLGLRLSSAKSPSSIMAIGTVTAIINANRCEPDEGARLLEDVLLLARDSFADDDVARFDGVMLRALKEILVRNHNVDLNRLRMVLRQRTADRWLAHGNSDRYESVTANVGNVIMDHYNYNKRKDKLTW